MLETDCVFLFCWDLVEFFPRFLPLFYLIYRSPQNASHRQAPFAGHGEDVQIPAIASTGSGSTKNRAKNRSPEWLKDG